jgi:hypothetical protein
MDLGFLVYVNCVNFFFFPLNKKSSDMGPRKIHMYTLQMNKCTF